MKPQKDTNAADAANTENATSLDLRPIVSERISAVEAALADQARRFERETGFRIEAVELVRPCPKIGFGSAQTSAEIAAVKVSCKIERGK